MEKIESLVAADLDEFYVEKLLDILVRARIQRRGKFKLVGVDMNEKTMTMVG